MKELKVTITGLAGSGKTVLGKFLAAALKDAGFSVVFKDEGAVQDLAALPECQPLYLQVCKISGSAVIETVETSTLKGIKMKYVSVNFSGATAIYNYSFDPTFHDNPAVGDRVVVPTKMKIDGTVTLTIATVVSFSNEPLPGADKPVIAFLPAEAIINATRICASLEAKRVQAIS